jgi:hypothetical protein
MDDYISKPVRISELQSALERWGPKKHKRTDTSFLARSRSLPVEKVLDQAILDELREMPPSNGISMLQELIDLFLETAPQCITRISESLDDAPKLTLEANALRSMGMNLGAKRIIEVTRQLEELGRTGNVSQASALLKELEVAYTQTKMHLLPLRG